MNLPTQRKHLVYLSRGYATEGEVTSAKNHVAQREANGLRPLPHLVKVAQASKKPTSDDQILIIGRHVVKAAQLLLEIQRDLGYPARQFVIELANAFPYWADRSFPREVTHQEVLAATDLIQLDTELGRPSKPDIVAIANAQLLPNGSYLVGG